LAGVNSKLHSSDAWADSVRCSVGARPAARVDVIGIPHGRRAVGSQYPVHGYASVPGALVSGSVTPTVC